MPCVLGVPGVRIQPTHRNKNPPKPWPRNTRVLLGAIHMLPGIWLAWYQHLQARKNDGNDYKSQYQHHLETQTGVVLETFVCDVALFSVQWAHEHSKY